MKPNEYEQLIAELTQAAEVIQIVKYDPVWERFFFLQNQFEEKGTERRAGEAFNEITEYLAEHKNEIIELDTQLKDAKTKFENAQQQLKTLWQTNAQELILELDKPLQESKVLFFFSNILKGNNPSLINAIVTQDKEELNNAAKTDIVDVSLPSDDTFNKALAKISENPNLQDFNAFVQALPEDYYQTVDGMLYGTHSQRVPLSPLEFIKLHEELVEQEKESSQKQKVEQRARAVTEMPKKVGLTDLKDEMTNIASTAPIHSAPKSKLMRGLTSTQIISQKKPKTIASTSFAMPFLNYRLNEIVIAKGIDISIDKSNHIIKIINSNSLSNNTDYNLLSKLGIKLTSREKKEVKQADKQLYYHSKIINPELAEMLAGSRYIKSTVKSGMFKSTIDQINAINNAILNLEYDEYDSMKELLKSIGFEASADQINRIIEKNKELRDEVNKQNLKNDQAKIEWLKKSIISTLSPDKIYNPKLTIQKDLVNLIHTSIDSITITKQTRLDEPNTIGLIKTTLLANLREMLRPLAKEKTEEIIKKVDENFRNWQSNPQDSADSIKDLVNKVFQTTLEDKKVRNELELISEKDQKQIKTQLVENILKVCEENLNAFNSIRFTDKETALKILTSVIDSNIKVDDKYEWPLKLLLRNVELDKEKMDSLIAKALKANRVDYLEELIRNPNINEKQRYDIYKSAAKKKIQKKLAAPDTMLQIFIQSNALLFRRIQTRIEVNLEKLQNKLGEKQYRELLDGMKNENKVFNFTSSKEAQEFARQIAEKGFGDKEFLVKYFPKTYAAEQEVNKLKDFSPPKDEELAKRNFEKNSQESFSFLENFSRDMQQFIGFIYKDGQIIETNLRQKIESKGTVSYQALTLNADQKSLLDFYLKPFQHLTSTLFDKKPTNAEETLQYIVEKLKTSPEFVQALIDCAANQNLLEKFFADNKIYGLSVGTPGKAPEQVLSIGTYAIKPIQVATKIHLLFREALSTIPSSSPAYQIAQEGFQFGKELADKTNEANRMRAKTKVANMQEAIKLMRNEIKTQATALKLKVESFDLKNDENIIGILDKLSDLPKASLHDLAIIKHRLDILSQQNSADEMLTYLSTLPKSDNEPPEISNLTNALAASGAKILKAEKAEIRQPERQPVEVLPSQTPIETKIQSMEESTTDVLSQSPKAEVDNTTAKKVKVQKDKELDDALDEISKQIEESFLKEEQAAPPKQKAELPDANYAHLPPNLKNKSANQGYGRPPVIAPEKPELPGKGYAPVPPNSPRTEFKPRLPASPSPKQSPQSTTTALAFLLGQFGEIQSALGTMKDDLKGIQVGLKNLQASIPSARVQLNSAQNTNESPRAANAFFKQPPPQTGQKPRGPVVEPAVSQPRTEPTKK